MENNLLLQHFQALRTQLFQTEITLQQATPNANASWNAALEQVQEVLLQCSRCAAFAEMHLYPLVEPYEPAVTDVLRQLQRTITAHHLAAAIATFPAADVATAQNVAAAKIKDLFDGVVLCHMQYLLRLQKALLPVLYRYYTPQLLAQLGRHAAKSGKMAAVMQQPQEEAAFRAMLYGAEHALAEGYASMVQKAAPALVMHY